MISVVCSCGRKFKAEDHHAGKHTKCPVCGQMLIIGRPVVASPSTVKDNGEVPSWWFPTDHGSTPHPMTPPTRSGSDPEAQGYVPPSPRIGGDPHPAPQPPSPAPSQTQTSSSGFDRVGKRDGKRKVLLGLAVGVLATLVLGFLLWSSLPLLGLGQPRPSAVRAQPRDIPKIADSSSSEDPASPAPPSPTGPADDEAVRRLTLRPTTSPSTAIDSNHDPRSVDTPGIPSKVQLLVPAYFYPGDEGRKSWQRLIAAASRVKVVAIVNPSSGPGDEIDANYALVIRSANSGKVKVVGYVSTNYAKRPYATVRGDIDRWVEFYPEISGFFFDQQSANAADVPYYIKIRDYARQKLNKALIVANPGALCADAYFEKFTADITCIFASQGFEKFNPPILLKNFSPDRFAAFPHNVADVQAMKAVLKEAQIKRFGSLYITDAPSGGNSWGQLPRYWDEEVEAIQQAK